MYTTLTLTAILGFLLFVWTQKEDPPLATRGQREFDSQGIEEGLQALFFRDFGYTLIGVKPISQSDNLSAYVFGGKKEAKRVFAFLRNAFANSSQFILRMPRENTVELIHKKSLVRQIDSSPDLQRFIANKYGSTANFLNVLATSKKNIFSLLEYNTLFIGICFGYGEQNSKFYIRKHWVGSYLKRLACARPFPFDQDPSIVHVREYSYFLYPDLVVRNKSFHSFFSRETDRDSTIGNRPIVELLGRFPIDRIAPV